MKMEQYNYLREMELEAALYETQQDIAEGRFSNESIEKHIEDIFNP